MILNLNSQIIWVFVDLLILFVLMKKFLFGPITQMLDDRAQQVSDTLDQADKRLAEAEQQQTAHAAPAVGNPSGRRCSVRRKRRLPLSFC